ncbi:NAD(P)H-dependent glycerol-3-phosphate dehydrogenase [Nemorincola caseinilytica]|uniref:Glycerol-3-phosphate dehydrogenase n=1 Tax=Nemorincola caseinilytica TaxID=2054315 RepID=A0ABP8NM38_9BACT
MKDLLGQVGIIGNGSWGTALAKILTDNGRAIHWWVRNQEAIDHLKDRNHNPHYLTSVRFLPNTILPTNDLPAMLQQCDTVIVAVPSAYAQGVMNEIPPEVWRQKNVISAIKGVLPDTNLLLNDHMTAAYNMPLERYVAITGPCHAEEVAYERLSYLTFSGLNDELTQAVEAAFNNSYINTTSNHDIWGAQFAAVLKNIYAIGAGIAHSLDYGDNFLSVYATNCYREMYGFLQSHFEKVHPSDEQPDFHTSAYLGDLLVTCYSLHSRNRTFGAMIGKGYSVKAATLEMNMVAEGYYAARGMQHISGMYAIPLPMATVIYDILWQGTPAAEGFLKLEKMMS